MSLLVKILVPETLFVCLIEYFGLAVLCNKAKGRVTKFVSLLSRGWGDQNNEQMIYVIKITLSSTAFPELECFV